MIKIRHGKDTYGQHNEMIDWCLQHISAATFTHSQAFGYLTITFHNDYDAFRFKMAWGGDKIDR